MGPQLKGCGRLDALRVAITEYGLQWGRSLRAAEGPGSRGSSGSGMSSFNGAAA